ncbi:MAG: hypothetical protein Q9204_004381 [Flavoplaca sp. TL-2023a]
MDKQQVEQTPQGFKGIGERFSDESHQLPSLEYVASVARARPVAIGDHPMWHGLRNAQDEATKSRLSDFSIASYCMRTWREKAKKKREVAPAAKE